MTSERMDAMAEVTQSEKCRVIAEKVMGWKWVQAPKHDYDGKLPDQGMVLVYPDLDEKTHQWPPRGVVRPYAYVDGNHRTRYFTDPVAMVEVMEKMRQLHCEVRVGDGTCNGWFCETGPAVGSPFTAIGPTPMHAVAEAAYQYTMSKENSNG